LWVAESRHHLAGKISLPKIRNICYRSQYRLGKNPLVAPLSIALRKIAPIHELKH
jgi:hypothetical protein